MKKHIIQGAFLALLLHSAGPVFAQESNESETPTEAVEEVQEAVEAMVTEEVPPPRARQHQRGPGASASGGR